MYEELRIDHLQDNIEKVNKLLAAYEKSLEYAQSQETELSEDVLIKNQRLLVLKREGLAKYQTEFDELNSKTPKPYGVDMRLETLRDHIAWHENIIAFYETGKSITGEIFHTSLARQLEIFRITRQITHLKERLSEYQQELETLQAGK